MVIIIGAGLSGLLTAYRLKNAGIPFKILEARSRIGGRITTVFGSQQTPVEMGATWFSSQHKHLSALLTELELSSFEQFMEGTVYFQPFSTSPAQAIQIPSQPPSYRIARGSAQLIKTLSQYLDKSYILLQQEVTAITFHDNYVEVSAADTFKGNYIVMAIPPKLWAKKITYSPSLPHDLKSIAQHTHTWMEDSIKVAFTYAEPFWRQRQISGTLFSNTGPITEFYDHCNANASTYALCGFVNSAFKLLDITERRQKITEQIITVFGKDASNYIDYIECVWSEEKYTSSESITPLFPHQNNGHPIFRNTYYNDRLFISSAEASPESPGYMDGAVYVANEIAAKIITNMHLR